MAKPSSKIDWTVNNPDFATVTVEPTPAKKQAGWQPDERPPREFLNWLFFNIFEWLEYFEGQTDALVNQMGQYDAVVGFGGTHASFNDLMADPDIDNLKNILITQSMVIDALQVLNKNDMNFTFKPNVILTKGASSNAIQITGNRVRFIGARFVNFDGSAIELSAASKNCLISQCYFLNNGTAIDDQGQNNVLSQNIEEI